MYICSVCGEKIPEDAFGDSQKHKLKHFNVQVKLLDDNENISKKMKYS